jgi:hypothetical protein
MNLRRVPVPDARTDQILNEIGQLLAEDTDYPLDGTLLYAEVDKSFVSPSIFKDLGDHILYRPPDLDVIGDVLLELWAAQTSDKRWTEIEYIVRGNKFTASFTYPDEIDQTERSFNRRDRIVAKHFGPKPIIYRPRANDDGVLEFKP